MENSTTPSTTGRLVSKSPLNATRATANLAKHSRLILDELFIPLNEEQCNNHIEMDPYRGRRSHCPITWDGVFCWNSIPASSVAARSCRSLFENEVGYKPPETHADSLWQDRYAIRECAPNGQWASQTNYNACLEQIPNQDASYSVVPMAVTYLILIFSFISLIFLLASAFIFIYFRTLKCSRTKVHLNLVTSLIIHSVMLIAISGPLIFDQTWGSDDAEHKHFIKRNPMLCKAILCLQMYSSMSSINWMFVEGLLLHSKITTSIFRKSAPFKLYYTLGWGLPLLFIIPWALEMEATKPPGSCWEGYVHSDWTWLLIAPRLTAVLVNFCFLVNIVRILVSRVKSAENTQFRKGMKATLLLFPLLGITHLFFCFNPQDSDRKLKDVYMITNAILMSSQGIFVATIYCFMNSEVQTSLRNAYLRATIRRNPNRRRKTHCENSLVFGSQVRSGELRKSRSFSKVKDVNLSISTKSRGAEVLRMASPTRVVVMPDNLQ